MTSLGIIGIGSIGTTLLRAAARYAPDIDLIASSRDALRGAALCRDIPGLTIAPPETLAGTADLVLLCVPPGAYLAVVERIAPHLRAGAILVSVTNAVPLAALSERVSVPVVKVIPTVAHTVGRGVSIIVGGTTAGPEHIEAVSRVFARFSLPVQVDDRDDRVASNLAGSAIALFAALCDAFVAANAARALTLGRETLDAMMAETAGAVAALAQSGLSWRDIVEATATPGGTTEAALDVLEARFPEVAADMVDATFVRQRDIRKL